MKEQRFMTAVEFAKEMDYDYTTIIRWLKKDLVPGAEFVEISGSFGVWRIPESALSMPIPRLGRKKKAAKKEAATKKAVKKTGN
jgi:hypothetical protein